MRIEKVCNGWIVYGEHQKEYSAIVLGVFNNLAEMTEFIKNFYIKLDKEANND